MPQVISREEADQLVRSFGGVPGVKSQIAYHRPGRVATVRSVQITNVPTGGLQSTAFFGGISPGLALGLAHSFKPPCIFGFEPWCWLPDILDPHVLFKLSPLKVINAQAHFLTGEWEGDVVHRFENQSDEAQTGAEKNAKTQEQRPSAQGLTPVPGSADLDGGFTSTLVHDLNPSQAFAVIQQTIQKVAPNNFLDMTGHFSASGPVSFLKELVEYWKAGTLYTSNGIDTRLRYVLPDGEHYVDKHLDLKLSLPVEGGVSVDSGVGVIDVPGGAIVDAGKAVVGGFRRLFGL